MRRSCAPRGGPRARRIERAIAATLGRWTGPRRGLAAAARLLDLRLGEEPEVRRELEARRPACWPSRRWCSSGHGRATGSVRPRAWASATMLCVHSWDNLTNKGVMHAQPDRVVVWNGAQRREAIELHGVAPDVGRRGRSMAVRPLVRLGGRRSRADLCASSACPARPRCCSTSARRSSSRRASGPAVLRWVHALRSSGDPRLEGARVIVRPHPLNADEWGEGSFADVAGGERLSASRRRPGGRSVALGLLRLDGARRRGGRDQHLGAARGRHRRPSRARAAGPGVPARARTSCPTSVLAGEATRSRSRASMAEHLAAGAVRSPTPRRGRRARRRFIQD